MPDLGEGAVQIMSIHRYCVGLAVCLFACAGVASADIPVSVVVPGQSDPYLSGMPMGSTASAQGPDIDTVPAQSPVLVPGLSLYAGRILHFSGTGGVAHSPMSIIAGPAGSLSESPTAHYAFAENGMSDMTGIFDELVGVFLGPGQPDPNATPPKLDFYTPASRDFLSLSPQLQQVFVIGNGMTSTGTVQDFVAPTGSTRLFLATWDSYGWDNNIGSFQITVTPEPLGISLIFITGAGLCARRPNRRRMALAQTPRQSA